MSTVNEIVAQQLITKHGITPDMVWKTGLIRVTLEDAPHTCVYLEIDDEVAELVAECVSYLCPDTLFQLIWNATDVNLFGLYGAMDFGDCDNPRAHLMGLARTVLMATIVKLVPRPVLTTV
jgi:hypothetical protein